MSSESEIVLVGKGQAGDRSEAVGDLAQGESLSGNSEDLTLIGLLREKPSEGFPFLIERHGSAIDYLVRKFAHSPEDREDLYQEVVLELLKDDCHRLTHWDPERAPLPAFLYLIVWRLCASYWKKLGRRRCVTNGLNPGLEADRGFVPNPLQTSPTQRSDVAFSELSAQIEDCFTAIIQTGGAREEDRLLVQLRAEGHPAKLVGRILGLAHDVIHTRFKRIRERLRDCLSEHGFKSIADVLTDLDPSGSTLEIGRDPRREK